MALNVTYNAERIAGITRQLAAGKALRRDVVADRRSARVEVADNALVLRMDIPGSGPELFTINATARGQLAGTLNVPTRYLDRLAEGGHHDIAADTLSKLLQREPKRHLWRFMGDRLRAVLSDRYRAIDNLDLMVIGIEAMRSRGFQVWDLRYNDDGGFFKVVGVHPEVERTLRGDTPGLHRIQRFGQLYPMVSISNSETGRASCAIDVGAIDGGCCNGLVLGRLLGQVHVGRKAEEGLVVYAEDTQRAMNDELQLRLRDTIHAAMDLDEFEGRCLALEGTTQRVIERPTQVVEKLGDLGVTQTQQEEILAELLRTGDTTQWGLAAAVTATVNPANRGELDDEQVEAMEGVGGKILTMSETEWNKLVAVA